MAIALECRNVSKLFFKDEQPIHALSEVDLAVERGELVAIVGPSGCGKSTLLNLVAGLMEPGVGQVCYGGEPVTGVNTRVSYVTQKDNLLPWRTVRSNVRLPLEVGDRARRANRKAAEAEIDRVIELVGLKGFDKHYPAELSGGMRKRAQLAQALVRQPDTLLMDEPFGALDAQLKLVLQAELLRAWEGSGRTLLFVTHDLTEAISIADRVIVMSPRPGRIKTVERIDIQRPRDVFTIRFTSAFGTYFERLWSSLREEITEEEM